MAAAALLLVSGVAALVAETTWLRWFRLLFGATAPAASATLVALFAGQALGAAWAARRIGAARRPLAVYGGLEIGTALGSLAVPLWLRLGEGATAALYDALSGSPARLAAARFAVALAATLPAALCLGAAFPALGAAALRDPRALGTGATALYGANLLGAAAGTALAAFWLPGWLGVRRTYGVAVALHALVGGTALALAARGRAHASAPPAPRPPESGAGPASERLLLGLAALSGLGAFAAQVLLIHAFAQVVDQSVHAFGAVLCVLLTALAAAALLVALSQRARVDPRSLLAGALVAAGLGLALFPSLLAAATGELRYVGGGEPWPAYLIDVLAAAALAAGPALLAMGLVFPAVVAAAAISARHSGSALGRLLAANTAGAIAGALLAPYALLPWLGPWSAFPALGAAYAAAALAVPDRRPRAGRARAAALLLGAVAWLLVSRGRELPLVRAAPGETVLDARSSPAGVVGVLEREGELLIRIDNHYSLGGTAERVHEERQGHLPLLLHPRARRVAFLGSATGISAGAATAHPVESIRLVEIAPGVSDAAGRFFGAANRGVHDDPRTLVVVDDARNYLRATPSTFDVIVADLFVPWRSGVGALYAREHFAAGRARLAEDGLYCQWLPLYQLDAAGFLTITATFLDVFPQAAVFRGDFYGDFPIAALVGWKGDPAPAREVSAAARRLAAAGERDRWIADPLGPWSLYVGPLAPLAARLARVPRNSDDWPRSEQLAARSHAGGARGVLEPFSGLRWTRFAEALRAAADAVPGGAPYPDLPEDARAAGRGGALLQRAGALWSEGRSEEASRALAAAARELPPRLLAAAPADPTAASVWVQ